MLRQIFGAALALGLSTAASFSAVIPIFDGTFVFTNAANNCPGSRQKVVYVAVVGQLGTRNATHEWVCFHPK